MWCDEASLFRRVMLSAFDSRENELSPRAGANNCRNEAPGLAPRYSCRDGQRTHLHRCVDAAHSDERQVRVLERNAILFRRGVRNLVSRDRGPDTFLEVFRYRESPKTFNLESVFLGTHVRNIFDNFPVTKMSGFDP